MTINLQRDVDMKKITCFIISVLLLLSISVSAFAADLTVSGAEANVGDTLVYTLNLSDVPTPVAGIQMSLFYDPEYLELDKNSVSCKGFPGYLANTDVSGEVMMNATEGTDGYDFTTKNEIISLTFKVLKSGSTDITYYIYEMYDIYEYGPGDYLKTYTLSSDIKVNGNQTVTDAKPVLNPDKQSSSNSGDFVNNNEATGEISPADAEKPSSGSSEDDDNTNETSSSEDPNGNRNNDKNTNDKSSESSNSSLVILIIVIAVILAAAAAVIAVVVIKNKNNKALNDPSEKEVSDK